MIRTYAAVVLLISTSLAGAPNEKKILAVPGKPEVALPAAVTAEAGVRAIARYDAMYALALPNAAYDRVGARLRDAGFELIELDTTIRTPGRVVNPAEQLGAAPVEEGLWLLQFDAPPLREWQAAVDGLGIDVIDTVPGMAQVVTATAEQVERLRKMPWITHVGVYGADDKFIPVAPEGHREFTVVMADSALAAPMVTRLRAQLGGFITETRYDNQLSARINADLQTARALVHETFVLGVEAYVQPQPSDERQALGITDLRNASVATRPPAGGNYLTWLASRGITPNALTQSGIVVDIADSGIDLGCTNPGTHLDLAGRKVYHGGFYTSQQFKDTRAHGTIVASIVGGNPMEGIDTAGGTTSGYGTQSSVYLPKDSDQYGSFLWGLGVAPGVRLGSTVTVASTNRYGTVADWTTHAVTRKCNTPGSPCTDSALLCPATVQNHSTNQYDSTGSLAGIYNEEARQFDISVRNADRSTGRQLAVTFSAGNYAQSTTGIDTTTAVMAPATAKNVISVGATESARAEIPLACQTETVSGSNPLLRHQASGYDTLAFCSRRGTADGRFKPDLVAPATLSAGARTFAIVSSNTYCMTGGRDEGGNPIYQGSSGTSYAAPVASGAIALLRYYYSTNYSMTPTPAMYKAMLVAGAKPITGSIDRLETFLAGGSTRNVAAWPNAQQGFGRIDLSNLLGSATVKSWDDHQSPLLQGQTYTRIVAIADPTKPVRIVLAWTDPPAQAHAAITEVNGLNLSAGLVGAAFYGNYTGTGGYSKVPAGCGRPVCPSPYDNRNNVEVINIAPSWFANGANSTFSVKVIASPLMAPAVADGSGQNNQDFALFVLNGTLQ